MQKKLIALAIAGLAAAPVFAQSNVTVYGLIDMGYAWRGDATADNIGSQSAINSGQANGSRLGFKGTEDLGNGLKALFTLEAGINVDRGSSAQGGLSWGRQAFVGLTGNSWGTVIAGRLYTPEYTLWTNIDPFGVGFMGQTANLITTLNTNRLDNTVAYVTPTWSGFNATLAYSTSAIGAETAGNDGDIPVWAISPVYNNGPLMIGLNYQQLKFKNDMDYKKKMWDAGITYDFKVVKVALGYSQTTDSGYKDVVDSRNWMLGVTVPVGKASILASYNDLNDKTSLNQDAHQWAIGVVYPFSKRTDVYAAYSDINNKNGGTYGVSDAGNSGQIGTTAAYQQGAQVGIRHRF